VGFGNVAGGLGTSEVAVADVALRLKLVEVVAGTVPGGARGKVLDGRGRWDIGGTAGFAFGDAGAFAGSFLVAVDAVEVDDRASDCRFAAVAVELVVATGFAMALGVELVAAGAFAVAGVVEVEAAADLAGVVVVVARGTEDGPSDGRAPGVLVGFLTGVG
jgi:hypothetical protein